MSEDETDDLDDEGRDESEDEEPPDIDMNTLAKKYKQMRKSGEYIGGLSSDAKYSQGTNKPMMISQAAGVNKTTKASGQADRFSGAQEAAV